MSDRTGTMEGLGEERSARDVPANAGLVLLYAPNHDALPPVFLLGGETVVIGREPPPGGMCIPQTAVSRVHASVVRQDGAWLLRDLESRNGVLVNGRFVGAHTLEADDEVRIGDAIFKFVPDDADGYARIRIDDAAAQPGGSVGGYVMSLVAKQIATIGPSDLSVLVVGETGTGKELAVRGLHEASERRGPMCALNCAAIPANLVESELFGWKRGAFSGADRDRAGLVRAAEGGTLFLDEIGDMPLDAQAKLLRMLETREVLPLGAARGEPVDLRVACATHQNLEGLVEAGRFRGDLFARLNGYRLELPALRRRKEDLYRLVRHFLTTAGRPDLRLSLPFMASLCHYRFPYNVRELETAIRRAVAIADGPELETRHLPESIAAQMKTYGVRQGGPAPETATSTLAPAQAPPTADALRALFERHRGNVSAIARELGKDRVQIHRWMRLHGIRSTDYR